jgi:hypothetical protein
MPEQRDPYLALVDHQAEVRRYREEVDRLRQELELAEQQYASAMRVNEQRRDENEHLRRLLVAVLPPDAVYQEARELTRRLRGVRP